MWYLLIGLLASVFFMGPQQLATLPTANPSTGSEKDCSYNLEKNKLLRVAVADTRPLYKDRENIDWVLIKKDAGVPAWKVWTGGNPEGSEMIEIGKTIFSANDPGRTNPDGAGKRVFIGRGHCLGTAGETCLDPLPHSTIFVATLEGAEAGNLPPSYTDGSQPGFWWDFDVYYDTSKLPANPTNNDLPDWIKQCQGADDGRIGRVSYSSSSSGGSSAAPPVDAPSFVTKVGITLEGNPSKWGEVKDSYWYEKTILTALAPAPSWAEKLGSYTNNGYVFDVWYSLEGLGYVILDPKDGTKRLFYYLASGVIRPQGRTLQLGSFRPIRKFLYEWWTPACKPAIYLYPAKETDVSVSLLPQGRLIMSIPKYGQDGWKVRAKPDGKLSVLNSQEQNFYPYLYYEADLQQVAIPSTGWVIQKDQLLPFFSQILPELGLNQQESKDFLSYWLVKLAEGQTWFISLVPREQLDSLEAINIIPPPNHFIRVRFYFENLDGKTGDYSKSQPPYAEKLSALGIVSQQYSQRSGFTAVDWGGMIEEGSCGLEQKSQ